MVPTGPAATGPTATRPTATARTLRRLPMLCSRDLHRPEIGTWQRVVSEQTGDDLGGADVCATGNEGRAHDRAVVAVTDTSNASNASADDTDDTDETDDSGSASLERASAVDRRWSGLRVTDDPTHTPRLDQLLSEAVLDDDALGDDASSDELCVAARGATT